MKKVTLIFILIISGYCYAQVGINTKEPKAVLDVKSDFLGIQFPRLTTAEIKKIKNPEEGLMVYNLTEQCIAINIGKDQPHWKCLVTYKPTKE